MIVFSKKCIKTIGIIFTLLSITYLIMVLTANSKLINDPIYSVFYEFVLANTILIIIIIFSVSIILILPSRINILFCGILSIAFSTSVLLSVFFIINGFFNFYCFNPNICKLYFSNVKNDHLELFVLYILESMFVPLYVIGSLIFYIIFKCFKNTTVFEFNNGENDSPRYSLV
jgi:hypothetical protein